MMNNQYVKFVWFKILLIAVCYILAALKGIYAWMSTCRKNSSLNLENGMCSEKVLA